MPRFALLLHRVPADFARGDHYDLLLETPSGIRTWALAGPPAEGAEQAAERLPDHRPMYLDYEGPISGDRGEVTRIAQGEFDIVAEFSTRLVVRLRGEKLSGDLLLSLPDSARPNAWRLQFTPDSAATT